MNDTDIIPYADWVLIEAAKRTKSPNSLDFIRNHYGTLSPCFHALCDMIAKHEQPPAERKALCACEAVRESNATQSSMMALAIRAIELWEGGFGA